MAQNKDVAIIGGGAAGIFAAINHAKINKSSKVTVFESSGKTLSKVLISGGGRCNVTNYTLDPKDLVRRYPRGSKELIGPFTRFGVADTIKWFEDHGVMLKTEQDKRVFPITDKSSTVIDCLLQQIKSHDIKVRLKEKVSGISKNSYSDKFTLQLKNNTENFDSVIITTGGNINSLELSRSLGHRIIEPVPSLFTFEIKDPLLEGLSGVSFSKTSCMLKFHKKKYSNTGPLLITHWGLSGPAVIVLSSLCCRELFNQNYNTEVYVDFIPDISHEDAINLLKNQRDHNLGKKVDSSNPFNLPSAFWKRLISVKLSNEEIIYQNLSKAMIMTLVQLLKNTIFEITGKGKFKEEFVTSGGVSLKEIDFKTMESKICKNLFLAGEVLDIDGITGGFNFQSAWTTSWIASQNI